MEEAKKSKMMRHANVLLLYGIFTTTEQVYDVVYIVTEFCLYGDLKRFLSANEYDIKLPDLIDLMIGGAAGITYVAETRKIVHRDLAARNLLVTRGDPERFRVKIADFGLSRDNYYQLQLTSVVAPLWSAPEALSKAMYTTASDVYSFGSVMYEIMTYGCNPWHVEGFDKSSVLKGAKMEKPSDCPESIYKIMCDCWELNPKSRPKFSQILERLMQIKKDFAPEGIRTVPHIIHDQGYPD